MYNFKPSELKTILHSKRANIYYLEYCRVLVKSGRVEYVTDEGKLSLYWNIPISNTTTILLGTGTSITQAAMRELSKAGVIVGFSGGGGTPLFCGTEGDVDCVWMLPQSEYRPTNYLQKWASIWFDELKRLQGAKLLQHMRIEFTRKQWQKSKLLKDLGFQVNQGLVSEQLQISSNEIENAINTSELFVIEARLTKKLYKIVAESVKYGEFNRVKQGKGVDPANRFLDHGNYLAYGLGATATWVLGLPHGFSLLHGKTRRGGLVFDAADLIKDGLVLPLAFLAATDGVEDQNFRRLCIEHFSDREALDFMIDSLKRISEEIKDIS